MENDLLRISMPGVNVKDVGAWQVSADGRIQHAARLCEYLMKHAVDLKLFWVVTFELPTLDKSSPELEIWTRNDGVRILWGGAPGTKVSGEAQAIKKIEAIRAFVTHHGPLDSFDNKRQQTIDVRSGIARLVENRRFAELTDMLDSIK